MSTTVAQMSREELKEMIAEIVSATIDQKFAELQQAVEDDGELRPDVVSQLLKQREAVDAGERGIPFEQVIKQLGIG